MNAFLKKASLALATASLPLATPSPASEPSWPTHIPKDWIFIPPLREVSEPQTNDTQIDAVLVETPVAVGTECVLTPKFFIFSTKQDPAERTQHQRLLEQWARARETRLVAVASALSIASFRAVGEHHSASAICHNNPEIQGVLRQAFIQSTALFIESLNYALPKNIKDNTRVRLTITGFTDPEPTVNTGNIALNAASFERKIG